MADFIIVMLLKYLDNYHTEKKGSKLCFMSAYNWREGGRLSGYVHVSVSFMWKSQHVKGWELVAERLAESRMVGQRLEVKREVAIGLGKL